MMNKLLIAFPLTFVVGGGALGWTAVSAPAQAPLDGAELTWRVPAGTTLSREITSKHYLVCERMTVQQGEDSSISQRLFDLQTSTTVRTTDDVLEVSGERPTKMRRYYDEARLTASRETSRGDARTVDRRIAGEGSIKSQGVVFTWIPEDGEYGRYFDATEGVEETLPGLGEDLGFRSLMPAEKIAEGASWDLPPGALADFFACGGDLNFALTEGKDQNLLRTLRFGTGAFLGDVFGAEEKGTVKATWRSTEEKDGLRLAVIDLVFDIQISKDMRDLASSTLPPAQRMAGYQVESALVSLSLKGGGEVRWDLGLGGLHSCEEIKADETVQTQLKLTVGAEGDRVEHSQELLMKGTLVHSVSAVIK